MTLSAPLRLLAALLFTPVLLLAGCASEGDIAPQSAVRSVSALDVGNAIRQAGAVAGWPTRSWWENYTDPQLNGLIAAALADNPGMAIAAARVRQAQFLAQAAWAGTLPQVGLDAAVTRKHWSDNAYYGAGAYRDTDTWNNTASLNLVYRVDIWGRDRHAAEGAQDALRAAAAEGRAAQLDLIGNVVRAYVALSLQYGLLDNTCALLAQEQHIVALARRRLQGGIGTQLDVTQAEIVLPETRRQIEALQETIALTRNQLAALIGQGPGAGDHIERPVLRLDTDITLPSVLPADLIGRRPDVTAARWRIEAAAKHRQIATSAFYPNINLLAGIGPMAAGGGWLSFLTASNVAAAYGPAISLPIFDGGRLRGQLGVATADYDIAVERYNQLLNAALMRIADQVVTLRAIQRQLQEGALSVDTAQRNRDIALRTYQRGLTDYLNVLSAQTQLLHQQQTQLQLQARRLTAYAGLVAALGGGLEDAAADRHRTQAPPIAVAAPGKQP